MREYTLPGASGNQCHVPFPARVTSSLLWTLCTSLEPEEATLARFSWTPPQPSLLSALTESRAPHESTVQALPSSGIPIRGLPWMNPHRLHPPGLRSSLPFGTRSCTSFMAILSASPLAATLVRGPVHACMFQMHPFLITRRTPCLPIYGIWVPHILRLPTMSSCPNPPQHKQLPLPLLRRGLLRFFPLAYHPPWFPLSGDPRRTA